MFSKRIAAPDNAGKGKALPARKSMPSILSGDFMLSGDMYSEGEINIDGKVEGNIKARKVNLGASGNVKGTITANSVSVGGRFEGKIIASKVFLSSTARVVGEISHESLEIEMGAYLEGSCRRTSEPMPAEQPKEEYMIADMTSKTIVAEPPDNKGKQKS